MFSDLTSSAVGASNTVGGAEWNGPAYDPQTNLILIGEVDWCATVKLRTAEQIRAVKPGSPWSAMATIKSNYPAQSGMTPTAGGSVFFGDTGGNFYALNAVNGQRLWGQKIGGAIGGGVITYTAGGVQRVAVATGFTSILWPTAVVTGKIVILGLPGAVNDPPPNRRSRPAAGAAPNLKTATAN